MFDHATSLGVIYQYGQVEDVIKVDNHFEVIAQDDVYYAKAVIVATGTVENKLNLKDEDKLLGKGVSFCAVCDGAFYKDHVVSVIGGGNSALEEAVYLTQFAKKVNVIMRRDVFRADQMAIDIAKKNPKVEFFLKYKPVSYQIEDGKISGLVIEQSETKEPQTIATSAVFQYIGAKPATSMVKKLNIIDDEGYILVNEHQQTGIPGLFGAGDVCAKPLRQIVTATSDGAVAAQEAFHYIQQVNMK
jgi:thioredoxin reductase (NADPH)